MPNSTTRLRSPWFNLSSRPLAWALLGLACAGCASNADTQLSLSSDEHHCTFNQDFPRAFLSKSEGGDIDIALEKNAVDPADDGGSRNRAISPASRIVPRQLVSIRVLWKPRSRRADSTTATNAVIHWYLFGDDSDQGSMLEYVGTGVVIVDESGDSADIQIAEAHLQLATHRGDMSDPLGTPRLQGTIHALKDDRQVDDLLAEIHAASQLATGPATAQPAHLMTAPR